MLQKLVQNVLQHFHDAGLTHLKKNPSFQSPYPTLNAFVQSHYRVSYVFADPDTPEYDVLCFVKKHTLALTHSPRNQVIDFFLPKDLIQQVLDVPVNQYHVRRVLIEIPGQ